MPADKSLAARYFCFLSTRSFGYASQKEHRPDYQALILEYQHSY